MNKTKNIFRPLAIWAIGTVTLLMIPLIAMQYSTEVNWTFSDFFIAGILFFGVGFCYILVTRILASQMTDNSIYRIAIGFALFTGLLLIWVNGAVGIIGTENNDINMLYFGVIAAGLIGAPIARFQPKGMSVVMFVMAIVQTLIALIALIIDMGQLPGSSVVEILGVNGFFITLFVVAALLFRYSGEEQASINSESEK